jgi:hypothetical protein
MLYKYKLLAILLLLSFFANAQERKLAFEKAVDYCNCKTTYAYLHQFTSQLTDDKSEKSSFAKIKNDFNNCDINNPISYSKLSDLLNNNNFKSSNQKFSGVIEQIKTSYDESFTKEQMIDIILEGIYNNPSLSNALSKYSDIAKLKDPLKSDLNKLLASFSTNQNNLNVKVENQKLNDSYETRITHLERIIEENKQSPFSPNWLSIILIIAFSLTVYILHKLQLSNLEERMDRHRNEMENLKLNRSNNLNQPFPQTSNVSNNFIKNTERSISELNTAISKLQNELNSLTNQQKPQIANSIPLQQQKSPKLEFLYAPIPSKDGTFNANSVQPMENQSSSFYKFTITEGDSIKATFEFLNVERAIKDATSSPELILNPVCKIKNALNQNAKKIRTIKPGIVIKQNDKWIVSEPAEIIYE